MKMKTSGIGILQKSSRVYQNYFRSRTYDEFYKNNKNKKLKTSRKF